MACRFVSLFLFLCDLCENSATSALESQSIFRGDARNAKGQLGSYDNPQFPQHPCQT